MPGLHYVRPDWFKLTHLEVYCHYAMGYFLAHWANPGSVAQGYRDRTNLDVGTMWAQMPPPDKRWDDLFKIRERN